MRHLIKQSSNRLKVDGIGQAGGKSMGKDSLEKLRDAFIEIGKLLTNSLTKQDWKDLDLISDTQMTLRQLSRCTTTMADTSLMKSYLRKVWAINNLPISSPIRKRLSSLLTAQNLKA